MNIGSVRSVQPSMTSAARPFLKWAGGKTQLLPELRKRIPSDFARYFEPFAGGAALLFDLIGPQLGVGRRFTGHDFGDRSETVAFLNDSNRWLAATYKAVRDNVEGVIGFLSEHACKYREHGADYFYEVRRRPHASLLAGQAADFIFLNKTGFNGLFRVNRAGDFNVPHGKRATPPLICDADNLRACSRALHGVAIWSEDFSCIDRECRPGDFVYFDPPYWPVSASADFTAYTKEAFGPREQKRLRDLALSLKNRCVKVLLSNADVPPVRDLYARGFNVERVEARRAINSKADKRGAVGELLIT